jgi:hypothetical protein
MLGQSATVDVGNWEAPWYVCMVEASPDDEDRSSDGIGEIG